MPRLHAKLLALSLPFAALAPAAALAQESNATTPPPAVATTPSLTLEECVARAMRKNFALQIQAFSTEVAREDINIAKAAFEPVFNATVSRGEYETSALSSISGRSTHADTTDARIGVSQNIVTGATVGVSTGLDRSGTRPVTGALDPAYTSDVALSITQPLLRGAGLTVNRAQIDRSKLGLSIASLDYEARMLQVIRDTEVAYHDLVFARGQLAVRQRSLELAERLLEENRTRRSTGVATDLDVLSAEVGLANAQNGIVTAMQAVRNTEDALQALIGQFEFHEAVGSVALPHEAEFTPSFEESFKLARERQPDYLATQALIKQRKIDVDVARNSARPTVDLGGAVGYNGAQRTYGTAFNRMTQPDGYNWQVDLTVSVPWGLRADRARQRSAQAQLRQEETRLQQLEQDLIVQVRAAVRAVETNRQSVEINAKATQFAEKQYELELARFRAGLSTSRQVLETQDDLEAARVNELLARVNLRNAIANLRQLETSSLERYGIVAAAP